MKIVVFVKQVPDIKINVQWNKDLTMQRTQENNIINPLDEYALETALRIKDQNPETNITAVCMGPPCAQEVLEKAIAMGVDNAILLSDYRFAGSDTLATSYSLAQLIKEKINNFDLIICGQLTMDGGTGQVGPSLAQYLDLPQITFVNKILNVFKKKILVEREVEDGLQEIEMKTPGVLCLTKPVYEPRIPSIRRIKDSKNIKITTISFDDFNNIDSTKVGMSGSPTYLSKLSKISFIKKCKFLKINELVKVLKDNE